MVTIAKATELIHRNLPDYRIEWKTWATGVPASIQPTLMEVKVDGKFIARLSEAEFMGLLAHEIAHAKAMYDEHTKKLSPEEARKQWEHGGTLFELYYMGLRNRYKITDNVMRSLSRKVDQWRAEGN